MPTQHIPKPKGFLAIGVFFVVGAVLTVASGLTLLFPGTLLDRIWFFKEDAHRQLLTLGRPAGLLFLLLTIALLLAGMGWLKRRLWGWRLGVVLITTNLAGDIVRTFLGSWIEGTLGILLAGLLLFYLTRPGVRGYFAAK